MNISIENTTGDLDAMPMIFDVVRIAKRHNDIDELFIELNGLNKNFNFLQIGSGSNHIWVKVKGSHDRVLLITG